MRTVFFALILSFFALPALAASPLFTVSGVTVDVTAENAIAAREQAFAEAQVKAFEELAGRMVGEGETANFTVPEPATISAMIQDFEITEEKLSSTRYVGTYTFRFKDEAVKNFLSGQRVRFTDISSRPVLVLPFYFTNGQTVLWSPRNEWMQAWNRARDLQGLVPLVVPIGDLMDVSDIGDNEALNYDEAKLARMLERYDAGEAALLIAVPDESLAQPADPESPAAGSLIVNIYRTDRAGPEAVQGITLDPRSGETRQQLFDRAAKQAHEALQRNWKQKTIASPEQDNRLQVRVSYASLEEWAETQRALERVYGINEIVLQSLTPTEARIDLLFQGSESRLRLALAQADMTLSSPQINPGGFTAGRPGSALVYDLYLNRFRPSAPETGGL